MAVHGFRVGCWYDLVRHALLATRTVDFHSQYYLLGRGFLVCAINFCSSTPAQQQVRAEGNCKPMIQGMGVCGVYPLPTMQGTGTLGTPSLLHASWHCHRCRIPPLPASHPLFLSVCLSSSLLSAPGIYHMVICFVMGWER